MNVTTIIPIHEFNEEVEKYLTKALDSVNAQDKITEAVQLIMVVPENIFDEVTKFNEKYITEKGEDYNLSVLISLNNGKTDFQSQVNHGVDQVSTDYFSILEFDDEFSVTYYHLAEQHIKAYPKMDLFLPILVETNSDEIAVKLTNQTTWSKSLIGENGIVGYLNTKALEQYTDYKLTGGIFKKSEYISVGRLKSNILLTFQYEFILRLLNNGGKIYTIPKIMCKHVITREGSLFDKYQKELSMNVRKFWFDTAKKESNFPTDREIDTLMIVNQ